MDFEYEYDYNEFGEDATPDYDLWEAEAVFRDEVAEREAREREEAETPPDDWLEEAYEDRFYAEDAE